MSSTRDKPFKLTLDRWEGNSAVLRSDDRQELIVDRKDLPPDSKEGEIFTIGFHGDKDEERERVSLAKRILNEFLSGSQELPASHDAKKE